MKEGRGYTRPIYYLLTKGAKTMARIQVGDRVRFTSDEKHLQEPNWYPPAGTIGTVDDIDADGDLWVEWKSKLGDGTKIGCTMEKWAEKVEE